MDSQRSVWDFDTQTLTFDRNLITLRAYQADAGQPLRGNHHGGVLAFERRWQDRRMVVAFATHPARLNGLSGAAAEPAVPGFEGAWRNVLDDRTWPGFPDVVKLLKEASGVLLVPVSEVAYAAPGAVPT